MGISEYIILNCENCKKPVAKIHSELLARIKKALHYDKDHGPHLYHVSCQGGFEQKLDQLKVNMTIDKAIEIKENHQRLHLDEYYSELLEADNLSIEALKYIKRSRTFGEYPVCQQLPGETNA
ncbi:hypothetical protein ES706_05271 [subsurface metagenome]